MTNEQLDNSNSNDKTDSQRLFCNKKSENKINSSIALFLVTFTQSVRQKKNI